MNESALSAATLDQVAPGSTPDEISLGYIVISVLLSSLVACTLVGNLFVIAAILIDKNLQTTANQLVLSLAVADLMVACLVMPLGAYNDINQGWWLGRGVCEFWTSADVLCCTASILNLLAIALDRYWAVTNVDYIYKRTRRRVSLMILCAWTVGAVVSLAPIFGWKDPDFARRVLDEHKCLVSQDVGYQIFATISTFYAPLVLLLALYWRIFQVARKRIRYKPGGRNKAAGAGELEAGPGPGPGAEAGAPNLMIKSGPVAVGGLNNNNKNERKQSKSAALAAGAPAGAACEPEGAKSFAQVRGGGGDNCSGYTPSGGGECGFGGQQENKATGCGGKGGQPPATKLSAVVVSAAVRKLPRRQDALAEAKTSQSPQREFNLTGAAVAPPPPTLTNDKFRLGSAALGSFVARAAAPLPAGRLRCQWSEPESRCDESSRRRDNEAAAPATSCRGAKMNEQPRQQQQRLEFAQEGEICLRRGLCHNSQDDDDHDSGARQATTTRHAAAAAAGEMPVRADTGATGTLRAACVESANARDHILALTGSGARDNKTNEHAPRGTPPGGRQMIELGDKLTSVGGAQLPPAAARHADDAAHNHNQPPRRALNLCRAQQAHSASALCAPLPPSPHKRKNCSLVQLDVGQLLATAAAASNYDEDSERSPADSVSACTNSQVSLAELGRRDECAQCQCCCGGGGDSERTPSSSDSSDSEAGPHEVPALACWLGDKRPTGAEISQVVQGAEVRGGGLPTVAAATKCPVDQILALQRELLASQGFREAAPLQRRQQQRSLANGQSLGSASSLSDDDDQDEDSSRSMLAAAATASLEPLLLVGMADQEEQQFRELLRHEDDEQAARRPSISASRGGRPEEAAAAAEVDNKLEVATVAAAAAVAAHDKLIGPDDDKTPISANLSGHLRADSRSPLEAAEAAPKSAQAPSPVWPSPRADNYKVDPRARLSTVAAAVAGVQAVAHQRGRFLSARPSMAQLMGVTRGEGTGAALADAPAGSPRGAGSLSIKRRFRALGQLVSFVQTSRQFNSSTSSTHSSTQSCDGDAEECPGAEDDKLARGTSSSSGSGGERAADNQPVARDKQHAPAQTTTTTGLEGPAGASNGRLAGRAAHSIRPGPSDASAGTAVNIPGTNSPSPPPRSPVLPKPGQVMTSVVGAGDGEPHAAAVAAVAAAATTTTTLASGRKQSQAVMQHHQQPQAPLQQRRQNMEIKREKKAAKTLAIITGVFVCCWLPFFLNAILMPICGPACTPSDLILSVLLWLGYLNSLLNPIIYTIFSPDFRRAFHRLLYLGRRRHRRAGGNSTSRRRPAGRPSTGSRSTRRRRAPSGGHPSNLDANTPPIGHGHKVAAMA